MAIKQTYINNKTKPKCPRYKSIIKIKQTINKKKKTKLPFDLQMKPKNGDFLPVKQKKRKRKIVEKKYNIDSFTKEKTIKAAKTNTEKTQN